MGFFLAGLSLGLAFALALTGVAVSGGGYPLAFALVASGPIVGGALAWWVVRDTPNVVTSRAGGERFAGAVLRNRPAMLVIAGYTFHSWELLGMWAWTPAFLAACFLATGSALDRCAGTPTWPRWSTSPACSRPCSRASSPIASGASRSCS